MHTREAYDKLFGKKKVVIGMVHLQALPGAPAYQGSVNAVIEAALADAAARAGRCGWHHDRKFL